MALNAKIMATDLANIAQGRRLDDQRYFHPLGPSLALTENLFLPALLSSPARIFGGPIAGYYFYVFLSIVLTFLGAWILMRALLPEEGSRLVALAAAILLCFAPYRMTRWTHLQIEWALGRGRGARDQAAGG